MARAGPGASCLRWHERGRVLILTRLAADDQGSETVLVLVEKLSQ